MEQATVGIVTLELGLQRSLEVKRLGGLDKASLNVVGLLSQVQRGGTAEVVTFLVLDLLLVISHQGLLLDIAVIVDAGRGHAVLVS